MTASEKYCRNVTKEASSTFYLASLLFPPQQRRDIWALYAFARLHDDFADDLTDTEKAQLLFTQTRETLADREVPHSELLWPEFRRVIDTHQIDMKYVSDLLDGLESDLAFTQPKDKAELHHYSYQVAGTVGALCTQTFGVRGKETIEHAVNLGIAMQLTNIIRDVAPDLARNRVYLPVSMMAEHDLTQQTLTENVAETRVRAVLAELAADAEALYMASVPHINDLPKDCQHAVRSATALYRGILQKVISLDYDVSDRVRLNLASKLGVVAKSRKN